MAQSLKSEVGLLLKHSSVYGVSRILSQLISFLMIPIYTAYITPAEYGIMELVHITVSLIEMVIALGISSGMARFYFDSDDPEYRKSVVSSAFIGLGGMVTVVISILMLFSSTFAELILDSTENTRYFLIGFGSLGLGVLNSIPMSYFRINKKSGTILVVELIRLVLGLSMNIYFLVGLKMGVWGIFVSSFIISSLTFVVLVPTVLRKVGLTFSPEIVRELVKFGLPLIPSNVATYIVAASDRYFIKEYVSIDQTGLYSLGYKFGTLVNQFVTSPFNQIWSPRRLELYGKENAEHMFSKIFTYFVFVLVFVGLAISILSREIVLIMADSRYWEAYKIIPMVTLAHIILSFFYHFNVPIIIDKKTKYFAYINVSNAVLNVGLNLILIKRFGIWGAVYSTLICYIYRTGMCFILGNRLHKIYVEWKRLGAMFGVAFAYYFAFTQIDVGNPFISFPIKTILCLTYPLALYLLRFFSREEIEQIKEFVRKGKAKVKIRGRNKPPDPPAPQ